MGNGYGEIRVTPSADMAAYDDAPPSLRWLLRNAVTSYSALHVVADYWTLRQKHNQSHQAAIGCLTDAVRARDLHHTIKAYGPTHPEARPVMHEAFA